MPNRPRSGSSLPAGPSSSTVTGCASPAPSRVCGSESCQARWAPTPRPTAWSSPMPSSRSTTCSIVSAGWSRAWSCGKSACDAISSRATASSTASGCCSRSSRPGSRATRPTGSSSATRCKRGTKSRTSPSSCGAIVRSPTASISTPSSISALIPVTSTPPSSDSARSSGGRNPSMSEANHVGSGKVRELYALDDDRLVLVASDRISTFDVVLPTEIPDKGRMLTGLSGLWFARTSSLVPNHLLALREDGRSTECRRLEMLPLECVVRGYITGSGWKDYQATGATSGRALPSGLREADRLPEPIFTPSTKAEEGHDENIDLDRAGQLIGIDRLQEVERVSLDLYRFASEYALARGIIIADTKFEVGVDGEGRLVLADEAFTPDSSA